MNITIETQEAQPLLHRKLVRAHASFEGATPSRVELRQALAAQVKVTEGLVIIKTIETSYGLQEAKVEAFLYDDEKALGKLEHASMVKRHEKSAKKAEAPTETPTEESKAEEKPAEEKPAEKAAEEKPAAEKPAAAPAEEKPAEEKKPVAASKEEAKPEAKAEGKPAAGKADGGAA